MAKGNEIVIEGPDAKGKRLEGITNGALKPGIVVQIDVSAGFDDNNRLTWEPYNPDSDGDQRLIAILDYDPLQGKLSTDAYGDGDRCFVYVPLPGDELNMLLKDVAGTGDDHSFGELLMVDDGTGKLIATTSSPEAEAFQLLEAVTDPTSDTLAHVIYTGY